MQNPPTYGQIKMFRKRNWEKIFVVLGKWSNWPKHRYTCTLILLLFVTIYAWMEFYMTLCDWGDPKEHFDPYVHGRDVGPLVWELVEVLYSSSMLCYLWVPSIVIIDHGAADSKNRKVYRSDLLPPGGLPAEERILYNVQNIFCIKARGGE